MKEKIKNVLLIIIVIFAVYGIFIIAKNGYDTKIRVNMVTHIIENPNLYEEELKEMGYDLAVFYTNEDNFNWNFETGLWDKNSPPKFLERMDPNKKLGYMGRGEIQLTGNNVKYIFDIGLYYIGKDLKYINRDLGRDVDLSIFNLEWQSAIISDNLIGYPLEVTVYVSGAPRAYFNKYNFDFTKYMQTYVGEDLDDFEIKKYVGEVDLRRILQEGLDLETQMVKMYKNKRKIS